MAKRKTKDSSDALFFLKLLLFFILGAIWLQVDSLKVLPGINGLPIGLIIGLLFAAHDHFQIDRKIEFAVLLAACILSYAAPIGIVIQV